MRAQPVLFPTDETPASTAAPINRRFARVAHTVHCGILVGG